jgi:phage gp36-like protein
MSYCTPTQLEERYGADLLVQLTDRAEPATGQIDATVIDRALADTDAEIDGFLAGRYQLPLATTPQMVTNLALAIAFYKLHRRETDDKTRRDYDDALKRLKDIQQGVFKLNVAGVEPASTTLGDAPQFEGPERVLTGGPMEGFI